MNLYRTSLGFFVESGGQFWHTKQSLAELLALEDVAGALEAMVATAPASAAFDANDLQAPVDRQEVWASGVTYYRSRSARIEESKDAGGGDFYDRVYSAERPELFFKAVAEKVAGPNSPVHIRGDAHWSVPEPELVLVINAHGRIVGYTIGNDMSSRDIEGANPLYLPQAKVYDRSCALGPGLVIREEPLEPATEIALEIARQGATVFAGKTQLTEMKRKPEVLVEYLYRDQSFPYGCLLLTGTGIIPPDEFTLRSGDEIRISITGLGTLRNWVA